MWHKILGHCNADDVTKLEHVVQGMKIDDLSKFDCETCTLAKQLNTRNRQPDARGTYPFELVHTDLAGHIDPVAKDGFMVLDKPRFLLMIILGVCSLTS